MNEKNKHRNKAMMEGWKKIRLDEFVKFQRGFDLPKDKFKKGNIPVYGSTSILGHHNVAKVKAPGVITGRSGTLGRFQYAKQDFWPHNTSLWVKDFKGNNPKFAYYLMQCLDFAGKVSRRFSIPFLVMSYYNILFRYGVERFAEEMKKVGLKGAIVPDIPPEEGKNYLDTMKKNDLAPILLFAPTTPAERMHFLASLAEGFIYCVARKGVTGAETRFSQDIDAYLNRCREATSLPLAIGFGIKERADMDFLRGKADIAVIGSQTLRIIEKEGIRAVGDFISSLLS